MRAVLFDFDGTLLDRDASVAAFIADQYARLKQVNVNVDRDTYVNRFIELDAHGYVWKDRVYAQLVEELQINMTAEELLQDYLHEFPNHCIPVKGLYEMLEHLKRNAYKIGMITNGFGDFQTANIRALGIEEAFDVILISEWEKLRKPDSRIFLRALQKLDVEAKEAVFVGDHPENDIQAAKRVGMKAVLVQSVIQQDEDADDVIMDLRELEKVLREWE
ncbi:HAD family hydrolase [Jeotgalibacillus sp. R-1-5s-1]|uniref:HAD family hydrolase n=1 Tax=Jeotgalibacillus sp. R-1-5s-1 TaxID=2555897 RepID=UPI0010691B51|nr:HAD-IA family hydrolase [Jeotgalibacillus sp. R-1-5s-1]TFE00841.1 HAD-IIIA family hydrolase [Jeotgalibacillus sp. R-1-5s-1]